MATCVVVDDSPFVRSAWQRLTASEGHACLAFAGPRELSQYCQEHQGFLARLAAIVLDFHLGDDAPCDGIELARQIRGGFGGEPPFLGPIFLATDAILTTEQAADAAGLLTVISKDRIGLMALRI